MIDRNKLQQMYSHLDSLGIGKSTYAPPAYRLAWQLGIDVTPPLFARFGANALFLGTFFGIFWGLTIWLLVWSYQAIPFAIVLTAAVGAGLLFGISMAATFRYIARKHRLPRWAEYSGRIGT